MIDAKKALRILIAQAETLERNVTRSLNDTATAAHSRYVSFKTYATQYNNIAREAEKLLGLPRESFSCYRVEEMGNYANTLWGTQKEIMESVALETGTLLTYLSSTVLGEGNMTSTQKKLLGDYAKIKQVSTGNQIITIQGADYPLYKETLEYLEQHSYIQSLNLDSGFGHMYMKTPAFEAFTEHLLSQETEDTPMEKNFDNRKVFIVHGHDHRLLNEVELMLRRIGLEPIIVKNEANFGRTVIEKIEDLTDVGFGIVLYTCCDEGRKKGSGELQDRARQNVIFEHGYLCAKLGRGRVAALNDDGIEIPSDLAGVLYIPHASPDWKTQLMREMHAAGLVFDATKA